MISQANNQLTISTQIWIFPLYNWFQISVLSTPYIFKAGLSLCFCAQDALTICSVEMSFRGNLSLWYISKPLLLLLLENRSWISTSSLCYTSIWTSTWLKTVYWTTLLLIERFWVWHIYWHTNCWNMSNETQVCLFFDFTVRDTNMNILQLALKFFDLIFWMEDNFHCVAFVHLIQ